MYSSTATAAVLEGSDPQYFVPLVLEGSDPQYFVPLVLEGSDPQYFVPLVLEGSDPQYFVPLNLLLSPCANPQPLIIELANVHRQMSQVCLLAFSIGFLLACSQRT